MSILQRKSHEDAERTTWVSPREDASGRLLSDELELLELLSDGVCGGGIGGNHRKVCSRGMVFYDAARSGCVVEDGSLSTSPSRKTKQRKFRGGGSPPPLSFGG